VFDFEAMRKDRRDRLEELRCWSGQPLLPRSKTELVREIDRLELVITQLREIEAERDLALQTTRSAAEKLPQEPKVKRKRSSVALNVRP
jgi:transposase